MELTKQQIQRVEHYLDVKNIKYIDVRFEVLDHIVSDIEAEMKTEIDFETVFYKVTDKWNTHLKETSSWYFGIAHSAPKVIIEKAKNHFKKLFLISNFLIFLLVISERKLTTLFLENGQFFLTNILVIINVFCILIFAFLLFKNYKIKEKTTYSFILKTQSLGIFLGGIAILFSGIIKNVTPILSMTLITLVATISYFHFYKKHKEAVKKYKIS